MLTDLYVKCHLFYSDFNQKWKITAYFGDSSQYNMLGKPVPRSSSSYTGSATNMHIFITLRCKRAKNLFQL
jgi:hypothetical protein